MKRDYSKRIYEKYLSLDNHNVEIKLKNGSIVRGTIAGYFKVDDETIMQWHIVESGTSNAVTMDELKGIFIQTKDMLTVKFLADDSIIALDKN